MNQPKRRRIAKVDIKNEMGIIDEFESNFYESLKNSSGSEFDDETKNDEKLGRPARKVRKMKKLNFQKKVLRSEKKINLLKLNTNLKQMEFDEFLNEKNNLTRGKYANCIGQKSQQKRFVLCSFCFDTFGDYKCVFCNKQMCPKCYKIHQESNCQINK